MKPMFRNILDNVRITGRYKAHTLRRAQLKNLILLVFCTCLKHASDVLDKNMVVVPCPECTKPKNICQKIQHEVLSLCKDMTCKECQGTSQVLIPWEQHITDIWDFSHQDLEYIGGTNSRRVSKKSSRRRKRRKNHKTSSVASGGSGAVPEKQLPQKICDSDSVFLTEIPVLVGVPDHRITPAAKQEPRMKKGKRRKFRIPLRGIGRSAKAQYTMRRQFEQQAVANRKKMKPVKSKKKRSSSHSTGSDTTSDGSSSRSSVSSFVPQYNKFINGAKTNTKKIVRMVNQILPDRYFPDTWNYHLGVAPLGAFYHKIENLIFSEVVELSNGEKGSCFAIVYKCRLLAAIISKYFKEPDKSEAGHCVKIFTAYAFWQDLKNEIDTDFSKYNEKDWTHDSSLDPGQVLTLSKIPAGDLTVFKNLMMKDTVAAIWDTL